MSGLKGSWMVWTGAVLFLLVAGCPFRRDNNNGGNENTTENLNENETGNSNTSDNENANENVSNNNSNTSENENDNVPVACTEATQAVDCEDSDACTTDTCVAGVCENTPADCNDDVLCTLDECDAATGACTNTPVDSSCTDGLFCNGAETCDPENAAADAVTGCTLGSDPCGGVNPVCDEVTNTCDACAVDGDCDDGIDCTTDTCDTGVGSCTNTADDASCDDGDFCSGTETCDSEDGCVSTGNPCSGATPVCDEDTDTCSACVVDGDCDDGVDCTDDTCDTGTGICSSTPNDSSCDDDLTCTGTETCDPENAAADADTGCLAGTQIVCGGTTPVCQEPAGTCVACASNDDCDDGFTCTTDVCNLGTGACSNTPDDVSCDDSDFCSGTETCDPADENANGVSGCVATGNPCSGAEPICDEANNTCVACTSGLQCSDGVDCTADTCAGGACQNTLLDCDDGEICTEDSCGSSVCVNDPIPNCCVTTADCDPDFECDTVKHVCEAVLPTTCDGLDEVSITLSPFAGATPPNPLPTTPLDVPVGSPFGVVLDVGSLGNNSGNGVFIEVTLDDNEINGSLGSSLGVAFFNAAGQQIVGSFGASEAEIGNTYFLVATMLSDQVGTLGCESISQVYNTGVTITFVAP